MLDARSDSFRRRLLHITKSFVGCRRRGACKRGQPLRFWMAPSQRGPALHVDEDQPELGCLSLWLSVHLSESVQFARCICVRSGSFKHCSNSIALIKRHHFTEMRRNKIKYKLLWGVVWSSKKRNIKSRGLSDCKRQYHTEAFSRK